MDQANQGAAEPKSNAPFNMEEHGFLFCALLTIWLVVALKVCLKERERKAERQEFFGVF